MVARRTRVLMAAGYSEGASLRRSVVYNTYSGNVGLNFAVTRTLAAYTDYQYYLYDFASSLVEEVRPPDIQRNSIRAGLVVLLPVF